MTPRGIRVLGSAKTLPRRVVPTAEVAALCGISATEAIRRTGVETCHWLSDDEDPFLESIRPGLTDNNEGIDRIIPHQTSKAGMEMMSRFFGWEKMVVTLGEVGNTIAASIPLALHRSQMKSGETALLIGTGSGTHYGGLIVQW